MFHVIENEHWFDQTMQLLSSKFEFVDLPFFGNPSTKKTSGKLPLHITFDDGDRTFYDKALPILLKHEAPTTLFVSPKIISENRTYWFQEVSHFDERLFKAFLASKFNISSDKLHPFHPVLICKCFTIETILSYIDEFKSTHNLPPLLNQNVTINELREIHACEWITVGGHTMNHPILANESDKVSQYEINQSIQDLSKMLNTTITRFACPNGTPNVDFDFRELGFIKQAGITLAVSTESRYISQSKNLLSLPRISITHGSEVYLNLKLKTGRHWRLIEQMRSKSEQKQRENLKSIVY